MKSFVICGLLLMTQVVTAGIIANEWVYIKNYAHDANLRVDGIDVAASLSDLDDSKAQWMFVTSSNNSEAYRIVNRWAQENGESQTWLWINKNDDGG